MNYQLSNKFYTNNILLRLIVLEIITDSQIRLLKVDVFINSENVIFIFVLMLQKFGI